MTTRPPKILALFRSFKPKIRDLIFQLSPTWQVLPITADISDCCLKPKEALERSSEILKTRCWGIHPKCCKIVIRQQFGGGVLKHDQAKYFGTVNRIVTLIVIVATFTVVPTKLKAADVSAGVGAVEEGDDRGRGAFIINVRFSNNWWTKTSIWGRSYGPVTETAGVLAFGKRFDVMGSKFLHSAVGVTSLAENTSIKFKDSPADSSSYTSTNLGLMLGLSYELYQTKYATLAASWDSHLFVAGEAGLLLVTGRKQILGLTAGISL